MKNIICALTAIAAISGVSGSVSAVEIRGTRSCGEWLTDSPSGLGSGNRSALIGFLVGLAVGTDKDFLKGTDNPSIFLWMDNYCRSNPLKHTIQGGDALYRELVREKGL